MDNLLCDESWLSGPLTPEPLPNFRRNDDVAMMSPEMDSKTVEEAITMDLEKEKCFSNHGDKFIEFLVSKKLTDARLQAVQWLIKTRIRLNLSFETIFSAANCFDRFVYVTSCNEWTNWMVELLVVTVLSIASKFNEVCSPSLQEFQMEGLNHMFHHNTVLEMELIVLRALDWRVNSVTSFSFSQIIAAKMGLVGESMMRNQITNQLLDDLCDLKMLKYPPSVVTLAAVWNVLGENAAGDETLGGIMKFFGQEQKENIVKCIEVKKSRKIDHYWLLRKKACEVKRVVTIKKDDYYVGNLSAIFQILRSEGFGKKRDREDKYEDMHRPAKRMTIVMSN
ncbi:hypothetical protein AALP_AA8G000600 [Arabis alpina]|uniref:Cyclin-like domain-containing protein n=1 Tax=Arabis alpina TaxID=50452 RepID=A0A087G401_ARAAL|nr:hypothetical protein AALP_AA8G000600 [Arabis alpina]